jgi:hypothetical protein
MRRAIHPTSNVPEINTEGFVMNVKTVVPTVVLALAFAAPAASFAQQSDAPLTRAQVRAQLVQIEKAGYQPAGGAGPSYPARFQAAEARVVAQDTASSTYGGVNSRSLATGAPASVADMDPTYGGR